MKPITINRSVLIGHRLTEWVTVLPTNIDVRFSIQGILMKDIMLAHWGLNETKFGGIH